MADKKSKFDPTKARLMIDGKSIEIDADSITIETRKETAEKLTGVAYKKYVFDGVDEELFRRAAEDENHLHPGSALQMFITLLGTDFERELGPRGIRTIIFAKSLKEAEAYVKLVFWLAKRGLYVSK